MNDIGTFNKKKQQLIFIISISIVLFIVNNIILGSVIPRLPGGSATGITTMFSVTFVSLVIKRIWCIPMVYFIYGSIGLISHLMVGDWLYLYAILAIILISAIYNWMIHRYDYNIVTYIVIFPVFMILLQYLYIAILHLAKNQDLAMNIDLYSIFLSLLYGYGGIILAYISYFNLNKCSLISRLSKDS